MGRTGMQMMADGRAAVWAAVGMLVMGCVLLLVSLVLPPPGVIDHSVLVAFGEICTFSGTLLGIRRVTRKEQNDKGEKKEIEYEKDR